jgi:hypothetical protein
MYTTRRGGFDREDARLHYAQLQSRKAKLQHHLFSLQEQRREAFEMGNWDEVERIQLGIDDTSTELQTYS